MRSGEVLASPRPFADEFILSVLYFAPSVTTLDYRIIHGRYVARIRKAQARCYNEISSSLEESNNRKASTTTPGARTRIRSHERGIPPRF